MWIDEKNLYGLDCRVYITKFDEGVLEYLTSYRRTTGTRSRNEMLFPTSGDAMKCLRKECHANFDKIKDLKNLTETGIQKYLANGKLRINGFLQFLGLPAGKKI